MLENCIVKHMTVIVPRNMNCNKGLIATQAKPVCIILHSIKEITSDERKTLNDPGYTLATFPKVAKYIYEPKEEHLCEQRKQEEASLHNNRLKEKALCIINGESSGIRISSENTRKS